MKRFSINVIALFFVSVIFLGKKAFCQSDGNLDKQLWVMGNFNWRLSDQWTFNQDIAYQHSFATLQVVRILFRPQINRQLTGAFTVQGGFIFFYNFFESNYNSFEIRPWIGFKLSGPSFWRLDFENNLRMEQRFEHTNGTDNWENGFRIRYKISTNLPINHFSLINKTLYGVFAYEFYGMPFNQNVNFTGEAVHRFDLGFGYKKNVKARYEAIAVAFDSPNDNITGHSVNNIVLFLKYKRYFNWE